jgi:hypothetical protein
VCVITVSSSSITDRIDHETRCGSAADARLVGWSLYGAPWLQLVAISGKSEGARKRRKQAKTVAVGCDRLPSEVHGKEGVDGSSPSEGSAKALRSHGAAIPMSDRLDRAECFGW